MTGEDALAPGLVGARFGGGGEVAALSCPTTAPDEWYTGVGAGARHDSVLELVNPDAGPAVADVTVYAGAGPVDVPELRGVSVPGHSSVRLDLGQVAPRRGELALHVVTSRGRLGTSVMDSSDELGARPVEPGLAAGPAGTDDRQPSPGPAGTGAGARLLTLVNPGDSEARASVKFVSEKSVFAPEGIDEVRVPPQGVARVSLSTALQSAIADGVVGVEVTSSAPVTATLRTFADGDLSHTVGGPPMRSGTSAHRAVGPEEGRARRGRRPSARSPSSPARPRARSCDSTRADLQPGRGTVVTVPPNATLVSVVPERTSVTGSVIVSGAGAAVVPLVDPLVSGLVPDVRPGLP